MEALRPVIGFVYICLPLLIYVQVVKNTVMLRKGLNETIDGLNSIEERLARLEHMVAAGIAAAPRAFAADEVDASS